MITLIVTVVAITAILFAIQCVSEGQKAQAKGAEKEKEEALKEERKQKALANLRN